MKSLSISILLIIQCIFSHSQVWTEPVNVSNMPGSNHCPDITMDNLGTLHCIWEYREATYFSKIYYSKSIDNGLTWRTPIPISDNDSLMLANLNIRSNSENNLFITYDYDLLHYLDEMIYMQIFDGSQWSNRILVSENIPASFHSTFEIDNNDRLHIFWFNWCGNTFYRYYENGIFSEIINPYPGSGHFLYFAQEAIDNLNNIHVVGTYHSEEQSASDDHVAYCRYNADNNTWSEIIDISSPTTGSKSIALDNNNSPHIAWRQQTTGSMDPDTTLYRYYNGQEWTDPQFVVEGAEYQQIVVDANNIPHIINRESFNNGFKLVHYYLYGNNWIGTIVDTAGYSIRSIKLYLFNNKLFTTYCKMDILGGDRPIMFAQADIITDAEGNNQMPKSVDINIYPNPFRSCTEIEYEINSHAKVSVSVIDISGVVVKRLVSDEVKDTGRYHVRWDGKFRKHG